MNSRSPDTSDTKATPEQLAREPRWRAPAGFVVAAAVPGAVIAIVAVLRWLVPPQAFLAWLATPLLLTSTDGQEAIMSVPLYVVVPVMAGLVFILPFIVWAVTHEQLSERNRQLQQQLGRLTERLADAGNTDTADSPETAVATAGAVAASPSDAQANPPAAV